MKQEWRILTSGPCPTFTGTLEEAMTYVEESTPLKKGWTRQWVAAYEGFRCFRYNSKGNGLDSYSVYLGPASEVY